MNIKEKYPCFDEAEIVELADKTIVYCEGVIDTRFIWCGPRGKMNLVLAWLGDDIMTNVRFLANLGRDELDKPEVVGLLGENGAVIVADRKAVLRREKLLMDGAPEGTYGVWLVLD